MAANQLPIPLTSYQYRLPVPLNSNVSGEQNSDHSGPLPDHADGVFSEKHPLGHMETVPGF